MKIVAIVQARMGSTRLPGKVLKDLGGKTALARVIGRVQKSHLISQLVVATSTKAADDRVAQECQANGAPTFRGDEADVLDRYYQAAHSFQADVIVRITSDCPLLDPEVTDATIQAFLDERPDYASNALEPTFPRGLDTEVMTIGALECTWREASEPYQRVHVTPYLYQNPGRFKLLSVKGKTDYSRYRWTLDTVEDLELLRAIHKRFEARDDFTWRDVLDLMEHEPALAEINSHIAQKALHEG